MNPIAIVLLVAALLWSACTRPPAEAPSVEPPASPPPAEAAPAPAEPAVEEAPPAPAPVVQAPAPSPGRWRVISQIDPLTDVDRSLAVLECDETDTLRSCWMSIRCDEDQYDILVEPPQFIGSSTARGRGVEVMYRFDRQEAARGSWNPSSTGTAVFVPGSTRTAFLQALAAADTLVVRVTTYTGSPTTATFTLEGVRAALAQLPCLSSL